MNERIPEEITGIHIRAHALIETEQILEKKHNFDCQSHTKSGKLVSRELWGGKSSEYIRYLWAKGA